VLRADNLTTFLCSWDRSSQLNINKCPKRFNYTQCILSLNCSTCFGLFLLPSSGAQTNVSTASATSQPLLLPFAVERELRLICVYANQSQDLLLHTRLARQHPHRTHELRSGSQDHHPSTNSVQKTICCNI